MLRTLTIAAVAAWFAVIGSAAAQSKSKGVRKGGGTPIKPPPGSYIETGGMVVMEAENTASRLDLWKKKTAVAGYMGSGYLEFTGNSVNNGPARSPLIYIFTITKPGTYRLIIRASRDAPPKTRGDQANDCYVQVEGDYTAGGSAGLDILKKKTKLFGAREDSWRNWSERLDVRHKKHTALYNFKAGTTYMLTLYGRSKHYIADRIVFFRTGSVSINAAKEANLKESPRVAANGRQIANR